MKYSLMLLVFGSIGLVFGVPHAHSYLTGLPVGVEKVNMAEIKHDLPAGMTRIRNPKSDMPLPEGFQQLATTHVHKK